MMQTKSHNVLPPAIALLTAMILLMASQTPGIGATGIAEVPGSTEVPTRIVTDGLDRTVAVPADARRIVTAGRAVLMTADVLYAFPGVPERIVGIGRISQGAGSFPEALDDEYGDKVVFERNVGPEQVAAVAPDLVILKSGMRENLGRPLEQLNIPVMYVDLETPDQYERDIMLIGAALGRTERAKELVEFYRSRRSAVTDITGDVAAGDKPSVLLLYYRATGGDVAFQVPPEGWIQTQLVTEAGGTPVWTASVGGGGWQTIGFEQIAAWDPDTLIIISYNDDPGEIRNRLMGEGRWRRLKAVESGRFYAFPGDYYSWDQPDTRWILGLEWLATRIHPERFASLDIDVTARSFFREIYGLNNEAYDRIIVPVLTGDLP